MRANPLSTLRDDLARLEKRIEKLERQKGLRDGAPAPASRTQGGR